MAVDHPRKLRSFVRRPGRITTGQKRALETLLPRWGIPYGKSALDPAAVFGREAPAVLDIGFGDGEALITTAAQFPGIDYLGIEVHEPGIGHLLTLIERSELANIRVVNRDAIDVVEDMLVDSCFDAVNLFFPDPWPKKRHHKRRIVNRAFLASMSRILKPSGLLHIATDWAHYAQEIEAQLAMSAEFVRVSAEEVADQRLTFRPPTKFERRGRKLGHDVVDFYAMNRA